jgi:drug/metabolite transporter (DMT)-like permease
VQLAAVAMTLPYGLAGIPSSDFELGPFLAVVVLGFLGTGWALVAMTDLTGRVGATRGTVAIYLTAPVAIALGVVFRDETVAWVAVVGTALILAGAWLTSRSET